MPPSPKYASGKSAQRSMLANGVRARGIQSAVLATGAGQRSHNKYVVLADASGTLTPAGELYYDETGIARPEAAFDRQQDVIPRNGNDYIRWVEKPW